MNDDDFATINNKLDRILDMRYHNPLIDDVMELFHVTQDMIYEVMLLQGCNVQRVQDALCIEAKDFETYMSHSEQFVHEVPEIRISAH